jgi:hypothetical protein
VIERALRLGAIHLVGLLTLHEALWFVFGSLPGWICGTGWPPSGFQGAFVVLMYLLFARGLVALAMGAVLAACARWGRSGGFTVLVGALVAMATELALLLPEVLRLDRNFVTLDLHDIAWVCLPVTLATLAGALTGTVAVAERTASVATRRRHDAVICLGTASVLVALGAFGLVSHGRWLHGHESKAPLAWDARPRDPAPPEPVPGKLSFAISELGNHGKAYPVGESLAVLVLACALGLAGRIAWSSSRPRDAEPADAEGGVVTR